MIRGDNSSSDGTPAMGIPSLCRGESEHRQACNPSPSAIAGASARLGCAVVFGGVHAGQNNAVFGLSTGPPMDLMGSTPISSIRMQGRQCADNGVNIGDSVPFSCMGRGMRVLVNDCLKSASISKINNPESEFASLILAFGRENALSASANQVKLNISAASDFLEKMGISSVSSINRDSVLEYLAMRRTCGGLSMKRLCNIKASLSRFFGYLHQENLLQENPCDRIKFKKIRNAPPAYLREDEIAQCLDAA